MLLHYTNKRSITNYIAVEV